MNGLKVVRTQCNMTIMDVAGKLGVSKQIVSAWEKGQKEIPEARKNQLSEIFGLEVSYFGEISQEKAEELGHKPKVCMQGQEGEQYTYNVEAEQRKSNEHLIKYYERFNELSLSERYTMAKAAQEATEKRIHSTIMGPKQSSIRDQIARINCYNRAFGWFEDVMELIEKQPEDEQGYIELALLDILGGLQIALGKEPDHDKDVERPGYALSAENMERVAGLFKETVESKKEMSKRHAEEIRRATDEFFKDIDPLKATDEDWERYEQYMNDLGL